MWKTPVVSYNISICQGTAGNIHPMEKLGLPQGGSRGFREAELWGEPRASPGSGEAVGHSKPKQALSTQAPTSQNAGPRKHTPLALYIKIKNRDSWGV